MPLAERIQQCAGCHGEDGNSRMENIPRSPASPNSSCMNQLFLMREGVRPIEAMAPFVKDLKDDEIAALAKHFAGLEPKPSDEPIDQPSRSAAPSSRRGCAAAPATCPNLGRTAADAARSPSSGSTICSSAQGVSRRQAHRRRYADERRRLPGSPTPT